MDVASLSLQIDTSGLKAGNEEMAKMTTASSLLEDAIKKVAAAFAFYELAKHIQESALLAARYETLGIAMKTAGLNAGFSALQMEGLEKALQKTGISMNESRQSLTAMAAANIDLSKSAQLARAAQDLAVVGGINSSEAFARVVEGIKSGRTEVLRTIGLNVQFEDSYRKLAQSLGKNSDQLTEQEKIQARVNTVLQQASGYAGIYEASMTTAGKQLLSMQRYSEDLQVKLGALFGPALSAVVEASTAAIKAMSDAISSASRSGSFQAIADSLGAMAGGGLAAIGDSIAFLVKHIKELEAALIAAGIAAAYAWGPAGLAALGNIVGPMVSTMVGLYNAVMAYAASATAATVATAAWEAALAILASPITLIIAGVATMTAGALLWDYIMHGSIDTVKEAGKAMDEHIAKQKGWLSLRQDALQLEQRIRALQSDGRQDGPATRQVQIQSLVSKALPGGDGKTYSSEEIDLANFYAAKMVDEQAALKATQKAIQDKSDAERKAIETAKAVTDAIREQNGTLDRERVLMTQGEAAAYAYDLAKAGIHGHAAEALIQKRAELKEQEDEDASAERVAAYIQKQDEAYQALTNTLNPLAKQAKDYADAVYWINQNEDEGANKALLLKAAYDTMTPSGIAAAAAQKKVNEEIDRLNQKDDFQTRLAHLNAQNATGRMLPDAYSDQLQKLLKSSDSPFAPLINSMENFGYASADAWAKWATGADTAAIHWSSMIRSMMTDMARMEAQQGEQSLLKYLNASMAGLFGGGGSDFTTNDGGQYGQMGGDSYTNYPTQAASQAQAISAVPPVASSVAVTINNQGQASAKSTTPAGGEAFGRDLEGAVLQVVLKHQRPGGALNPV